MTTNRRLVEKSDDAYSTPFWATQLLLDYETFKGPVWECCAGAGHISRVLLDNGLQVYSSDLHYRDKVEGLPIDHPIQINTDALLVKSEIPNIITNPPYCLAEEFIDMCLRNATHKFALLLRLAFLEGSGRYKELYSVRPPSRVYVLSDRVSMFPIGDTRTTGGTTSFAWFVWDEHDEKNCTELKWLYYDPKKEHKYIRPSKKKKVVKKKSTED